jgi:hypothetical protein
VVSPQASVSGEGFRTAEGLWRLANATRQWFNISCGWLKLEDPPVLEQALERPP